MGSSEEVARYSGVPVGAVRTATYAIQGLCVAVAVLVYVPRLGAATATTGLLWELQAITAVVIGGTALRGGIGRVWGTVCGAVILEVVGNIMVLSSFVSEYLIGAVQGAIIIVAMLLQRSLLRRGRGLSHEVRAGAAARGRRARSGREDKHEEHCDDVRRRARRCAAAGPAGAADKTVTVAVSIPAADHGWTGGVVFQAERAKPMLEARHPGLKIIVKTSPDGASQANALEDLTTQGIDALVTLPQNSDELTDPIRQVKAKGVFVTVVDRALSDPSISGPLRRGQQPRPRPRRGRVPEEEARHRQRRGDPRPAHRHRRGAAEGLRRRRRGQRHQGAGQAVRQLVARRRLQGDAGLPVEVPQDRCRLVPGRRHGGGRARSHQAVRPQGHPLVIGGAGMKEMIKRVADGDAMMPVDVLYPPAMVATAMELTVDNFYDQVPVRGRYILDATLVTKENAKQFYFPDSPY